MLKFFRKKGIDLFNTRNKMTLEKARLIPLAKAITLRLGIALYLIKKYTKKKIYITLNRPFVYMIVDENNVPAFIGAVTSLDK